MVPVELNLLVLFSKLTVSNLREDVKILSGQYQHFFGIKSKKLAWIRLNIKKKDLAWIFK